MRVNVRLFAHYREAAGTGRLELDLPEGSTVADAKAAVEAAVPGLDLSGGMAALGEELVKPDTPLREGAELAFLPPVSGGGGDDRTGLTEEPLEPLIGELVAWATAPPYGAVVSFVGTTRSPNKGREVRYLTYEAYESMAEATLARIAGEMRARWPLGRVAIVHRLGRVNPAEASIVIVVSSPHRPEAFEAARYALERVKLILPVWKKEHLEGGEVWVEGGAAEGYRL
ncbi:molybdopterin synthase subunit MoaE;molybdopterin synthase subunit MoaD [Oceanithermus profundus DSM 14977]|uniref:Molybdopterin synthase subunit MoaEmolybdopterin synthase subunit MoaD n=1 Tax=Oceanithermus profundus (strain DSM 14977 / NBRC 100410 / VKM B-2274 / 506) TaxID=670487 RepID=E4U5Y7_OCEP5|nr:molybdenum cofactor biosynthesis protein MoaE [Oceanithermus profundus]ADR35808.1 molybdopterin synthase subunit MoaE;molybdopterin synthase subunit MoaD [Oceanithermus profundus DSM 14977]